MGEKLVQDKGSRRFSNWVQKAPKMNDKPVEKEPKMAHKTVEKAPKMARKPKRVIW